MMLTHCHELFKPVSIMILVNLALAFVNLLMKKVLNEGTDYMSIITYRQAISFIFMAPIAFIYERQEPNSFLNYLNFANDKKSQFFAVYRKHKVEVRIIFLLFLSALLGVTVPQNLFLLGLEYTSATFSCAFLNMVPVFTFIMAVPFGIEKVNVQSKGGKAKVMGTFVCIGGALLLVLYKGMPLIKPQSQYIADKVTSVPSTAKLETWIIGSIILTGLVGSGLCYVAMSWCVKQSGPVFTAAFTPLIQIFVAILDFSVLKEEIYLGSVAGSALVIAGMYILLWGKSKEQGQDVQKDTQTNQDVERQ
ncbi:hypothetical protein LR48_Vigan02g257900 [Vigna angularis]|uniref:WAT1-related protein n=1 Tax=Phaseolus angularis TaxID=3914 RepID=A0A0L9U1Z1_PHAAN|nr:hypothetical protein LR48_Vigan02g257900 [Vigna angularis]